MMKPVDLVDLQTQLRVCAEVALDTAAWSRVSDRQTRIAAGRVEAFISHVVFDLRRAILLLGGEP